MTKKRTQRKTKDVKAWAVVYHDKPTKLWQTFLRHKYLIYKHRKHAVAMNIGPVVRVTIRIEP